MSDVTVGVVHIAAQPVQVGCRVRQRCAWCGALLEDHNVHAVAFETDDPNHARVPAWETGSLVLVDGNLSAHVPHVDGDDLPDNACGMLDPAVTG